MRTTVVRKRKKPSGSKLNKRQVRQVKAIVGRETEDKTAFVALGTTSAPAGPLAVTAKLTAIGQGIASNQRTGDHIILKEVYLKVITEIADTYNTLRFIVFQWIPNDAVETPTVGAILQDPALGVYSHYNDTNLDGVKYRILLDRVYLLNTGSYNRTMKGYRLFGKRLARKKLVFNPTATTGFNQIYTLMMSDSIAAPNPTFAYHCKVTFTDA